MANDLSYLLGKRMNHIVKKVIPLSTQNKTWVLLLDSNLTKGALTIEHSKNHGVFYKEGHWN